MKILQISEDLPPVILGGSGRIAWETSLALVQRGHEVHLLTSAPKGSFSAMQDGIHIHTTPRRSLRFAHFRSVFSQKVASETLAVIDAVQPDLIHAHGLAWQTGYRWIKGAVQRGIPVVYTCHGVMHIAYGKVTGSEKHLWLRDLKRTRWETNPFRNMLIRRALNQTKKIICVSDTLKKYIARFGYTNTVTLHNGIDLSFWKVTTSQADARKQLGLPADRPLFLLAGRLGHDKGGDVIAKSLPPDAELILAGDIPKGGFDNIKDRVHSFRNQSPEKMRLLYCACDAAVVPSIYLDPFPTVCLESMAMSRPVIATTFGGAKEAVIDGVTGWVINPEDTDAFRKKLEWCTEHRSELSAFGKAGRKRMEEVFSLDIYIGKLLAIYREAATRP